MPFVSKGSEEGTSQNLQENGRILSLPTKYSKEVFSGQHHFWGKISQNQAGIPHRKEDSKQAPA